MQNACLFRLRQRGVNYGAAPTNSPTDFDPPAIVQAMLNAGYNEFLAAVKDFPIATLDVQFPTIANVKTYALNPVPPNGAVINPSALRVYQCTYTYNASGSVGQEYYIPIIGTPRFRLEAGAYTRRVGYFGARPYYASQLFGKRLLDLIPGTATAGDLITLTICPDPSSTPLTVTCANGGPLAQLTDVPLFPPQFHMALVEFTLMKLADAANKTDQRQFAQSEFARYIDAACEFGSSYGEGDAEQVVSDPWAQTSPF